MKIYPSFVWFLVWLTGLICMLVLWEAEKWLKFIATVGILAIAALVERFIPCSF